jgi:hypothetical protein
MSTIAVENGRPGPHMDSGSWFAPCNQGSKMRIVETGMAGLIALASQVLIVAAVLL